MKNAATRPCTFGKFIHFALATLLATFVTSTVAQNYPTKPIRLVIAFPPGGSADLIARMLGSRLAEALGQPVVIDNRPGGRQLIASELVAKSVSDGYTLFLQGTAHVTNPGLLKKLPYNTVRDFAPITMFMESPLVFVTNPSVKAANIGELISLAKAAPGKLNYGSSGPGTGGQLAIEMLKHKLGIDIVQVPYKGAGPALVALLGGQVDMVCTSPLAALPHTKSGKLKALAVTSARRSQAMPEIPTVAESGVPGFHATVWYALLAPAGTPRPIVQRLHAETVKIANSAEVKVQLQAMGAEPVGNSPEELGQFLKTEIDHWSKLIQQANISAD